MAGPAPSSEPRVCPACAACGSADPIEAPLGARCAAHDRVLVAPRALARSIGDPRLGARVGERFDVLELRALGGSASVYVALDEAEGDLCALKFACIDLGVGEDAPFSADREVAALLTLAPQIAPNLRASAPHPATPWLALDLVEHPSLATLLRDGPLAPERARAVARALVDAVARMHASGVVHGDLKPAHVLVDPSDPKTLRLVDFGSARVLAAPIPRACGGATPAFAAPELGPTGVPTVASDVFALGCVLARILADPSAPSVRLATAQAPENRPEAAALLATL
ncbi:MAG: protein kinase [Polyangiaceae bacterium]